MKFVLLGSIVVAHLILVGSHVPHYVPMHIKDITEDESTLVITVRQKITHKLTVRNRNWFENFREESHWVSKHCRVFIDGKEGRIEDVTPGMRIDHYSFGYDDVVTWLQTRN